MDYIEIQDNIHDALVRVKSILNVLFYSNAPELEKLTVPTLMLMAEEQIKRLEAFIKELKVKL